MHSLKTLGLQAWVSYMELFGIPWRIGKYPNGASEEVQDSLVDAVQAIGMDGSAVMPEGMKLEIISAMGGGSGSQVHQHLADWCDRQISKAILGQTLTADTGGGSYAQGSVHDGIRRTLLAADAVDLAATLQRDLIEPWCQINFGADVEPPVLRCVTEEPVDRKSFVDCLVPLVDRGLRVEQSVIRDRMGIPAPAEGPAVEVLTPVSTQKTPVGEA
jgi:phage gp29-like protein